MSHRIEELPGINDLTNSLSMPAGSKRLLATYRDTLLHDVIPFWLRHGIDREFGGIIMALNRDGSVIDTDKSV